MMIVERGREPRNGDIVMVASEGSFMMQKYPIKSIQPVVIEAVAIAVIRKLVQ